MLALQTNSMENSFYLQDQNCSNTPLTNLDDCQLLQPDQVILSTNLFFKLYVLLPLVTGELLQNTADVTSITYKLYNIKI